MIGSRVRDKLITDTGGLALLLILAAALLALLIVSAYLFFDARRSFPQIEYGSYTGALQWPEQGKAIDVYVEHSTGHNGTLFLVFGEEWSPQFVDLSAQGSSLGRVTLNSPFGELALEGRRVAAGHEYAGSIRGGKNLSKGQWSLYGLRKAPPPSDSEQLRHWVLLASESYTVKQQLAAARSRLTQQQNRTLEMESLIEDKDGLRSKAEEELSQALKEYQEVKDEYKVIAKKAEDLAKQFQLARRVTPMGKLAVLARDTLERENRWIGSMLRTDVGDGSTVLEDELKKGEHIMSLKNAIAREKARISELNRTGSRAEQGHPVVNAPSSLDELWKRPGPR